MALVPMLGIGFHSFIDGFIYAITLTVSIFTGQLAATGIVLGCHGDSWKRYRQPGLFR
jgi:hypothetical protein